MEFNRPKNETKAHFLLKEISKYILWGWGYNKLGTEVGGMYDYDVSKIFYKPGKKNAYKHIIDCIGLKKVSQGRGKYYYDARGIEAKASLSDFKNGFCGAIANTYIISPVNTIPISELPEKIGLIECDLDNFQIKKYSQKISDMKGINIIRKAKKRIDSRFQDEESYRKWCSRLLEKVAYRSGSELLFWRNYIELKK